VSKIEPSRRPIETAKTLQQLPFPFAKPSQIVPSISLKTKGNFGRKEPFQNLWVLKHSNPEKPTKAIGVISEHKSTPKEHQQFSEGMI
jgi:hypothetical protein